MNWLPHIFGLDNTSGPIYAFWSGIGSDIGELAIIGGLLTVLRRSIAHHRAHTRQQQQLHDQLKSHLDATRKP